MKLGQVIDIAGPMALQLDFKWKVDDNGAVVPVPPVEGLAVDTEVEVLYYWYHHFNPELDKQAITAAIETHDFGAFCRLCRVIEDENMRRFFFPAEAIVFVEDTPIGTMDISCDASRFSLISGSDYECG